MMRLIRHLACVAGGLGVLASCTDSEVILPGKREPISAVYGEIDAASGISSTLKAFTPPKPKINAEWPQNPGNEATRTTHAALSSTPSLIWRTSIGTGDRLRHRLSADPVVYNNTIFALDSKSVISAVSFAGDVLWSKDLTPAVEKPGQADGGGIAAGDGLLFVATGYGKLWAISAQNGAVQWSQVLLGSGNSQPAYKDGLIYLVSNDSTAWAIEAKTGRIRWQVDGIADNNNAAGTSGPAVSEKFVLYGFGGGELQAAFRKGGLVQWSATLAGGRSGRAIATIEDIGSTPVIHGDTVFAANTGGRLAAFDIQSGERRWSLGHGAKSYIWPAGNSLFFVNDLSELMRVDRKTGAMQWTKRLPSFLKVNRFRSAEIVVHHGPVLAGGSLIVASSDGVLRFFDPGTGQEKANINLPDGATTAPIVAQQTLFVVTKSGELLAFR